MSNQITINPDDIKLPYQPGDIFSIKNILYILVYCRGEYWFVNLKNGMVGDFCYPNQEKIWEAINLKSPNSSFRFHGTITIRTEK